MNILLPLILTSIAGLSTLIGALFIFKKNKNIESFLAGSLSFSGSIMILISIFDLLKENIYYLSLKSIIIMFFCCLITIYILDKLLKGRDTLYSVGIISLISLVIHNIPEGILTFVSSVLSIKIGIKLCIAIALHNIPEGLSIAVPIYYSTHSKGKGMLYSFIASIAEPLGALIAMPLVKYTSIIKFLPNINVFVAFIMIILSISEIIPKSLSYKKYSSTIFGLLFGIIIFLIANLL